jgi:hypothetical protein
MEVLVSMAIFIAAATFTIGATSDVLSALDRSGREQLAIDLARSKLAELEAGLIALEDLRDGTVESVGSIEQFGDDDEGRRWLVDVETVRSDVPGLTVVEITVSEEPDDAFAFGDGAEARLVRFTLRQLVRLREQRVEEYVPDEMMRGLPEAPP